MHRTIAVALITAAAATSASAAGEPNVIASARLGTLTVTSAVYVSPTTVDLRGVWNDTKVKCNVSRRITVDATVERITAAGGHTRVRRVGKFRDMNCAEGGPNVGFTLTAKKLGMACASGRFRPGRYSFVTKTTEPARKLRATASVDWQQTRPCS